MINALLALPARLFLGKGIDKKMPFLVALYKRVFASLAKDVPIPVTIPLATTLFVSSKDAGLGMFLRTKGVFEPLQTKAFLKTVKKGMIVFDIGANVGYYTIVASKLVGKTGKVYAFEPDPRSRILLEKNIKENNCRNVFVVKEALAAKNGRATLLQDSANPGESSLTSSTTKAQNTMVIATITLDQFVQKNNIEYIDLIKMDIEGGEVAALQGATKTLGAFRNTTLFIECNTQALQKAKTSTHELVKTLQSFGFHTKNILNEFSNKSLPYTEKALAKNLNEATYVCLVGRK